MLTLTQTSTPHGAPVVLLALPKAILTDCMDRQYDGYL